MKTTTIKITKTEQRYARALSKRTGNCPRPNEGSVAHGLKWALRWYAKSVEKLDLNFDE